jgi:aspartate racemase
VKTIGLIGATSFGSNLKYVEIINKTVNYTLGGQHSAQCIHYSFDFHVIEACLAADDWDQLKKIIIGAAVTLEKDGADFIVLCATVLHQIFSEITEAIHIPVLHVVDVVSDELVDSGVETVGVLGTKYTLTLDYHREILRRKGITPIAPLGGDVDLLHTIIYDELCHGIVREKSKRELLRIIDGLYDRGAEGVVLASTELGMLVQQTDTDIPLFDTALIHAERAAIVAVKDEVLS